MKTNSVTSSLSGRLYLVVICLVASLGGLLFGFDTAVVSGAQPLFTAEFKLGDKMEGFVTSSAIIGCLFGALAAGLLTDRFGRKKVLLLSAVLFFISAVWCWFCQTAWELVWARLVGGLGIGIASLTSPLYIAEVSPPKSRGRLVALQQLAIVLGILAAFFGNSVISGLDLSEAAKWRWMFLIAVVPAVVFGGLIFLVPESPRWLTKQGRAGEARAILGRVVGDAEAETEMIQIAEAISHEGGSLLELLKPGLRRALLVGVALAILTQVTGINVIMYYAPKVFTEAGFGKAAAYWCGVLVGLTNLLFTLLSMAVVDRLGRKPLLLVGSVCMGVALAVVGYGFLAKVAGIGLLVGVLAYVGSFAFSMGVVGWVVISEIYPTRTRGRAMSVATASVWGACFLVSVTFPSLLAWLGSARTFWTYGALCVVAFLFVWFWVPETKGRSLEEIERSWAEQ
jgi:MFS transporter, SP family, arabinose:H+ symporter